MTVTIENDSVLEQREAFTVHLGRSSGLNDRIHVLTSESLVIIDNDDGELKSHIVNHI